MLQSGQRPVNPLQTGLPTKHCHRLEQGWGSCLPGNGRSKRPEELPRWQEWFGLLKQDGYQGYVANESAYTGPDPEKVLRMYTALFQTMTAR